MTLLLLDFGASMALTVHHISRDLSYKPHSLLPKKIIGFSIPVTTLTSKNMDLPMIVLYLLSIQGFDSCHCGRSLTDVGTVGGDTSGAPESTNIPGM